MRRKRRRTITIDTERDLVIEQRSATAEARCEICRRSTTMVSPQKAGALAGVTQRTIYRWVEAAKLHFTESPDGHLLICLNSLKSVVTDK
ncbi:MAG: hypothetical protein HY650_03735 [Acidobacteria bacterium]|nr:hypothetical protein [Acidobacteriota bacterium]